MPQREQRLLGWNSGKVTENENPRPLPLFTNFDCVKSCPVTRDGFYYVIGVVSVAKLTEKQKRFVAEYLVDLNATQAAIRAGYSKKTAEVIGYENLRKPQIADEIEKRQEKLRNKLEITQERVIEEIAGIAFANASDFVTITATGLLDVKPTSKMPKEKLPALAGIKYSANGAVEIKLHDKPAALRMLAEHLGLFNQSNGNGLDAENNIFEVIDQSTGEELDTSAIPEIEHPSKSGNDLVE